MTETEDYCVLVYDAV